MNEEQKNQWQIEFSRSIIGNICDPKNSEFRDFVKQLDDSAFMPILNAISVMKIKDFDVYILSLFINQIQMFFLEKCLKNLDLPKDNLDAMPFYCQFLIDLETLNTNYQRGLELSDMLQQMGFKILEVLRRNKNRFPIRNLGLIFRYLLQQGYIKEEEEAIKYFEIIQKKIGDTPIVFRLKILNTFTLISNKSTNFTPIKNQITNDIKKLVVEIHKQGQLSNYVEDLVNFFRGITIIEEFENHPEIYKILQEISKIVVLEQVGLFQASKNSFFQTMMYLETFHPELYEECIKPNPAFMDQQREILEKNQRDATEAYHVIDRRLTGPGMFFMEKELTDAGYEVQPEKIVDKLIVDYYVPKYFKETEEGLVIEVLGKYHFSVCGDSYNAKTESKIKQLRAKGHKVTVLNEAENEEIRALRTQEEKIKRLKELIDQNMIE